MTAITLGKPIAMDALIKLRLTNDNGIVCGPGTVMLFDAIEKTGSVRGAAEYAGMSYSKAWKIIRDAERNTGANLIERSNGGINGGRAGLTDEAADLVGKYRRIAAELDAAAEEILRRNGC